MALCNPFNSSAEQNELNLATKTLVSNAMSALWAELIFYPEGDVGLTNQ